VGTATKVGFLRRECEFKHTAFVIGLTHLFSILFVHIRSFSCLVSIHTLKSVITLTLAKDIWNGSQ
jgi:hypothetical protein